MRRRVQPERDVNGARVIYTIGPSYRDVNRIWIGTDDGVIATTADGGLHWTERHAEAWRDRSMKVFIDRAGALRSADGIRGRQHAPTRRS